MMYKIAIVEDSMDDFQHLKESLDVYHNEFGAEFSVVHYKTGMEFLDKYQHQFDLIFMDIQLPYYDGLKVSEELRKNDPEVGLIFVTNLAQFATHGYKVSALDYVVKPIIYSSFVSTMKRALKLIQGNRDVYKTFTFANQTMKVKVSDIRYFEVFSHVITIYIDGEEPFQVRQSLSALEEEYSVSPYFFIRPNSYDLINPRFIKSISKSEIILNDGKSIRISRNKGEEVSSLFARYMGQM